MLRLPFFGRRREEPPARGKVMARYDAAQTTRDNARHWAAADLLSADAAASPSVRQTLRSRARYEVANNSYAKGIVLTLANDSVGTGPRLQMLSGDPEVDKAVEQDFRAWAKWTGLAQKLRTMRMARCQDGEAFGMIVRNPRPPGGMPVQLDLMLVEADRIASDIGGRGEDVDGVFFDKGGKPSGYRVLRHHPGGDAAGGSTDAIVVPARYMVHVFRADRPEQHRGVPEIVAALPLFAQLRRYTQAVLSAAEAAADFAGIIYTDAPPGGEADAVDPMDVVQLERNMLLTMPGGWKMSQLDPKQPATSYSEFKHEILNEIARCLNIPYNIAACNSSGYNYASGRLDHQTYHKSIKVDREFTENVVLDKILAVWLREWSLARGPDVTAARHVWMWDGNEHVDPLKEANAQARRLEAGTTTLADEYARQGKDWEMELRQIARERELMEELGIAPASPGRPAAGGTGTKENEDETD